MNTKMLTMIIVAINVIWLSTAVVANGIATNNYMRQLLQDDKAYAIPHGYKATTGHQDALNMIIDKLGATLYSASEQSDSQKVKLQFKMVLPLSHAAL